MTRVHYHRLGIVDKFPRFDTKYHKWDDRTNTATTFPIRYLKSQKIQSIN